MSDAESECVEAGWRAEHDCWARVEGIEFYVGLRVRGGVVDDGDGATAVDVADNFKMAEYFKEDVLEGKVVGGGKSGLGRYACFT